MVSSNGSISENLSHFIDAYLQPLVLSQPIFVQDTIQFFEELEISSDSILVVIDVEAL